jgi:hypothetical protein
VARPAFDLNAKSAPHSTIHWRRAVNNDCTGNVRMASKLSGLDVEKMLVNSSTRGFIIKDTAHEMEPQQGGCVARQVALSHRVVGGEFAARRVPAALPVACGSSGIAFAPRGVAQTGECLTLFLGAVKPFALCAQ